MMQAEVRAGRGRGVGGATAPVRRNLPVAPLVRDLVALGGLLAGWRLVLLLFATLVAYLGPNVPPPQGLSDLLDRTLVQWDAGWYLAIARDGYSAGEGGQASVAFYPLLPLLIRLVYAGVASWRAAGALVVHAALFGAILYLHALVRLDHDRPTATRAVAFLLLCPTAVFLTAVYTESLLLLTMIAAVYHARRGQWWAAGLWGAAAGLTKLVGGVVLVALLWEYWRGGWWRRARRPLRTVPALALVPAGALTFLAYLHLRFGSYRVHFAAQEGWFRGSFFHPFIPDGWHFLVASLRGRGHTVVNYYYPQANTFPSTGAFMLMDLLLLLAFAAIGLWLCWKVRGSYGLLVLAILGLAAFSGSPQSLNRFVLILFPAFIWFALVARRPIPGFGLLIACGTLQAFYTFLFVNGFWAG